MDRIVITGYGVKSPGGNNIKDFQNTLEKGISKLKLRSDIFPEGVSCVVADVEDDLVKINEDKRYRKYPRFSKLAIASTDEAVEMSKLTNLDSKRVGLFFGTTLGGIEAYQQGSEYINEGQFRKLPVYLMGNSHYHSITSAVATYLGVRGIAKTLSTGCTASMESLEEAMIYLQAGLVDIAIVGGADAANGKFNAFAFGKARALPYNQTDEFAGIPFTKNSKGFALSEAGATIILEKETDAIKRKAKIYGYVDAVASNNDAVSIYSSDDTGENMLKAMEEVAKGRKPDYINSQALGLQANDMVEYINSKKMFNHEVPITSIKGMIGHPFGASGIIQVISALISMEKGFIPPSIKTDKLGYEDLNLITETTYKEIHSVLITTHGYGGNNACAYITKK